MSRIILSKYDNGEERVVVGWDHPANGCFWQEFNQEPTPDPVTGDQNWDGWEEMRRHGGYMPGIRLDRFEMSVPEDLRPLITDDVMSLLNKHASDGNSGRIIVDLTRVSS
jgi:hypothetical protein